MNVAGQTQTRVRELRIDEEGAGQRIDNFLLKQLKGVPKSRIYRILRKGEVRVNQGRIKPTYRLQAGDLVRIPPVRTGGRGDEVRPAERTLELIERAIVYEDRGYLVLNKPSGLAVHGGSGVSYGVIEGLRALRPQAKFLELAHRLDRDTSGCLLIAKKRSALRAFHELQRSGKVDKQYLCLVMGRWEGGRRRVDAPLRKNTLRSGERVVRVADDGKPALSLFEPVALYGEMASLMRIQLITGRTHQVRVHARFSGHPIAGDDKYGDSGFNRTMQRQGLRRLFLHASRLSFPNPEGGELIVEAPIEPALEALLKKLEQQNEA